MMAQFSRPNAFSYLTNNRCHARVSSDKPIFAAQRLPFLSCKCLQCANRTLFDIFLAIKELRLSENKNFFWNFLKRKVFKFAVVNLCSFKLFEDNQWPRHRGLISQLRCSAPTRCATVIYFILLWKEDVRGDVCAVLVA